jgi:hypothetical protein
MMPMHTRSRCDECGDTVIAQADGAVFRCNVCESITTHSVTSAPSGPDVNATVAAPAPVLATVATISDPVAKATKGKAGTAGVNGPVRRSTAGTGLRVGEADAVRPATSEVMDVTARRDEQPNSDPVSSPIPPAPANCGALEASLSSSNTPEASSTTRKAPSGSLLGEPSRILDRASFPSVDPGPAGIDLEAAISELESDWAAQGVSLSDPLGIPAFLKRSSDNVAPFARTQI